MTTIPTAAADVSDASPVASMAAPSSTRWLAALALLLVFAAGAGTGWAIGAHFGGPRHGPRPGGRDGMLLDGGPIERYSLSTEQRARIDSVLIARRGQIDGFWRGPGQSLRSILDSTRADVRAVLTPAQRERFDSAHAEHERRLRDRFGRGPGLPGPGGIGPGPIPPAVNAPPGGR